MLINGSSIVFYVAFKVNSNPPVHRCRNRLSGKQRLGRTCGPVRYQFPVTIDGYQAVISFDPDIQLFRGEFVGLNGGADFYAADVQGLEPRKHYSGKFSLRVDPATHEAAAIAAAAQGQSLNQWATQTIRHATGS